MQEFETEIGKIFYCIYTLHKRQLISQERRGRLKDLLISTDDRMTILKRNLKNYNEQQIHQHLLMMCESNNESYPKLDSEPSEENQSIKSARTLQLGRIPKPRKLNIEKSAFLLAKRIPGQLSARSSQKRISSSTKIP